MHPFCRISTEVLSPQEVTKRCRLSWLTNSIIVYESKLLTASFCLFSNFLRRLAVAFASTFLYGADQRGLPRSFCQVFLILSFRSAAYVLSGFPRTFFQVFRVLSLRSSAYFLSGLPNLSFRSSAHFLSGLPHIFYQVFRILLSGLPRTFFQVFRILSVRSSESYFQIFRALSVTYTHSPTTIFNCLAFSLCVSKLFIYVSHYQTNYF